MKKAITLIICLLVYGAVFAQVPVRVSLKGIAIDSGNAALPFATVMLLTPKDSTLVNFGRADEKWCF